MATTHPSDHLPPHCCFVRRIGLGVWSPDEICCGEGADLELNLAIEVFKYFFISGSPDHIRHSRPSKVTGDSSIPDEPLFLLIHDHTPQSNRFAGFTPGAFQALEANAASMADPGTGWPLVSRNECSEPAGLCRVLRSGKALVATATI